MEVNLVGQSTRVFTKRIAKHPRLRQHIGELNFKLLVKQRYEYEHARANHQIYRLRLLRERT
jgi:hypothetical protein